MRVVVWKREAVGRGGEIKAKGGRGGRREGRGKRGDSGDGEENG